MEIPEIMNGLQKYMAKHDAFSPLSCRCRVHWVCGSTAGASVVFSGCCLRCCYEPMPAKFCQKIGTGKGVQGGEWGLGEMSLQS